MSDFVAVLFSRLEKIFDPHLRIDIGVTVGVNENLDNVRRLLLSLLKDDPVFMAEPVPRVVVTALDDYNVAVELQVWLDDERRHVEKRFELREKAFNTLIRAGVELPFETLQLQPIEIKSQEKGEAVSLKEERGTGR